MGSFRDHPVCVRNRHLKTRQYWWALFKGIPRVVALSMWRRGDQCLNLIMAVKSRWLRAPNNWVTRRYKNKTTTEHKTQRGPAVQDQRPATQLIRPFEQKSPVVYAQYARIIVGEQITHWHMHFSCTPEGAEGVRVLQICGAGQEQRGSLQFLTYVG